MNAIFADDPQMQLLVQQTIDANEKCQRLAQEHQSAIGEASQAFETLVQAAATQLEPFFEAITTGGLDITVAGLQSLPSPAQLNTFAQGFLPKYLHRLLSGQVTYSGWAQLAVNVVLGTVMSHEAVSPAAPTAVAEGSPPAADIIETPTEETTSAQAQASVDTEAQAPEAEASQEAPRILPPSDLRLPVMESLIVHADDKRQSPRETFPARMPPPERPAPRESEWEVPITPIEFKALVEAVDSVSGGLDSEVYTSVLDFCDTGYLAPPHERQIRETMSSALKQPELLSRHLGVSEFRLKVVAWLRPTAANTHLLSIPPSGPPSTGSEFTGADKKLFRALLSRYLSGVDAQFLDSVLLGSEPDGKRLTLAEAAKKHGQSARVAETMFNDAKRALASALVRPPGKPGVIVKLSRDDFIQAILQAARRPADDSTW